MSDPISKCDNYTLKWYNGNEITDNLSNFTNIATVSRFHTFTSLTGSCPDSKSILQVRDTKINLMLKAKHNVFTPSFGRQGISSTDSIMSHRVLCGTKHNPVINNDTHEIKFNNIINI